MSPTVAAAEVASFLEEEGVHYAIIGGLAVQYWGQSRTTHDVDIVVAIPQHEVPKVLAAAAERFKPRVQNAVEFALANRVLLISTADGTPVDIALGIPGYEEAAIDRAFEVTLGGGRPVRILAPEDLIIHKLVAGRPRDLEDIVQVIIRQEPKLDLDYIRDWLNQFSEIIEDRDLSVDLENALTEARRATGEVE